MSDQMYNALDWDKVAQEVKMATNDSLVIYPKESTLYFKINGSISSRAWFKPYVSYYDGKPSNRMMFLAMLKGNPEPKAISVPAKFFSNDILGLIAQQARYLLCSSENNAPVGLYLKRTGTGMGTRYVINTHMDNDDTVHLLSDVECQRLLDEAISIATTPYADKGSPQNNNQKKTPTKRDDGVENLFNPNDDDVGF